MSGDGSLLFFTSVVLIFVFPHRTGIGVPKVIYKATLPPSSLLPQCEMIDQSPPVRPIIIFVVYSELTSGDEPKQGKSPCFSV